MKKSLRNYIAVGCVALAVCTAAGYGLLSDTSLSGKAEVTEVASAGIQDGYYNADEDDWVDTIEDSIEVEGDEILISEEEVPLGPGGDTKTTTTSSSKKSVKKKKQKKEAKKSKVVTKKKTKRVTSSQVMPQASVVTETTTVTTQKKKYTKGSKILKITTIINTTVKTSTTPIEQGEVDIMYAAKKADSRLLKRFKDQGYKYVIDTGCASTGLFSSRNRQITLRYQSDVVYHELGHYLAYTIGRQDITEEFQSIYNEEKENYTGGNKLYVTQNASEYFAESYRDYVTRSTELKTKRPKTYAYLTRVLNML